MEDYVETCDDSNWNNKYAPKKISDIFGIGRQIKDIQEWLDNYGEYAKKHRGKINKKKDIKININVDDDNDVSETAETKANKSKMKERSCMMITGTHGCGKTSIIYCILKEKKYDIKKIDLSKVAKMKEASKRQKKDTVVNLAKDMKDNGKTLLTDFINKTMNGTNIYDTLTNKRRTKTAIIIDEIETIATPVEKSFIASVIKKNEMDWRCPIIFISNNHHTKLINAVRNNTFEVKMPKPSSDSMFEVLIKICEAEKIVLEDKDLADKIIEHSLGDYRKLITILQDIKEVYNKKIFTKTDFKDYSLLLKKKDIDNGIYEATHILMNGYTNIDDTMRLYETEKTLVPLMMHQNFLTCLKNINGDKLKTASEISEYLSKGDLLENYIHNNQNWDLQDSHGFYSCTYPSYLMTKKLNPTNKNVNDTHHNFLIFPLDLNRTSIRNINYTKNILNAKEYLPEMNINDYLYINKILKTLMSVSNMKRCKELFKDYGCSIKVIESMMKIDKINGSRYSMPTGAKKQLNQNI
uniref:AAA+ ATPase domain-containing protein n=1 Tax=viral metagenome TaxID=1070528 RepID=A0A6C0E9U3_9ZZZZ